MMGRGKWSSSAGISVLYIQRLSKVLKVHSMANQVRIGIEQPFRFQQLFSRHNHQVGPVQKPPFHFQQRRLGHSGQGAVFVDAVVNQNFFVERSGDDGGGGIEYPIDDLSIPKCSHGPPNLVPQQSLVQAANGGVPMHGNDQGIEHENIRFDFSDRRRGCRHFLNGAAKISCRHGRCPITDGIDP